ncbi:MAG: dihydrodipicolinate synthase family protein [Burkholderiaceae bacterium]|nr:dihydrodipicolinate synthase family protein [Burkholderiaceae bacterium]
MMTALVTTFDVDGQLDKLAMRESVRFQLQQGIAGLCPLGGTGEPLSLTLTEHKQIIDLVVEEVAGRVPVVVGTLLGSQADIIECANHAKAAGADVIMVMPPCFFGMDTSHTRQHFQTIADRVGMPMMLFHSPKRSGVRLGADAILGLLKDIPLFIAIKESSSDMALVAELLREAPPEFSVLQGYEECFLPTLALGGHGAVFSLGCLVPRLLCDLYDAFQTGDITRAQRIQLEIMPLCRAIYGEPNPGPLKLALQMVGRNAGSTRAPIYAPSIGTRERLEHLLPVT